MKKPVKSTLLAQNSRYRFFGEVGVWKMLRLGVGGKQAAKLKVSPTGTGVQVG